MYGHFAARLAVSVIESAARSKSTISASGWQGWILHLHGPVVYAVVAGLLFLEVGIVIGFFIPGEIATILGGVIASQHHANLALMIVVVSLAASIGNISGYWVGRGLGPRLLELRYLKDNAGLLRARQLLARRGGPAVFVARWVVFVRAVLPGLAGMSHMQFRKFVVFSVLGGTIWGSMWVSIGYAAGASYSTIEKAAGSWSLVILGVVLVAVAVFIVFRKRKEKRENKALLAQAAGLSPAPSGSGAQSEK
ncbi:MAG: DedA family protein [Acidimicrobiales bacterium]